MSFQRSFLKNVATIGFYKYLGQALWFLASIVTARLLTPEEYGITISVSIIANFLLLLLSVGINSAVIRYRDEPKHQQTLHFLVVCAGLALSLIMVALAYPITVFYSNELLFWPAIAFGGMVFSSSFGLVPAAIVAKHLEFKIVGKSSLIRFGVLIAMTIIMAYYHFSYWAIIIPQIFAPFAEFLYLNAVAKVPLRLPTKIQVVNTYNEVKGLVGNLSVFNFFNYWARNTDNLLAERLFGEYATGIYNRAYSMLTLPINIFTGAFNQVQLPSFQKLMEQRDNVVAEYSSSLAILTAIILPISLILILFPEHLTLLLWGQNWIEVSIYLPIMGVLLVLQSMGSTTGAMFVIYHKEKTFAIMGSINAVIMIAAIVIGAQYSILTMLFAYAFAYTILCIPITVYWGFYKSFRFNTKQIIKTWLVDFTSCLGLLICEMLGNNQWIIAFCSILLAHKLIAYYHLFKIIATKE